MKITRLARLSLCVISVGSLILGGGSFASASAPVTQATIASSPNAGTDHNSLTGIACPSSTSCIAVGSADSGSDSQTLVESWNGASWSVVASPNVASAANILSDVACVSSSFCVAVGNTAVGATDQTLVESWNGASWNIVTSPSVPSESDELIRISCLSTTSCTAVGYSYDGSHFHTLVESWNGAVWNIVTSPNSTNADNLLTGVSCFSETFCSAVGYSSSGSQRQTLIESWNGAAWSVVASPNAGNENFDDLFTVSCSSATACTAVGYSIDSSLRQTLVESWDGASWSVVESPNAAGNQNSALNNVACSSSAPCTAVGEFDDGTNKQTLIETWNGVSWSIVTSPNVSGNPHNDLLGIGCSSATSCAAVGYTSGTYTQTLAVSLLYSPQSPSTPVVKASSEQIAVSWSSTNGPGTTYVATASPGGATCTTTTTSCSISGLKSGESYSISVTATNAVGSSDPSPAVSVTLPMPATLAATGSDLFYPWWLVAALFMLGGVGLLLGRRGKVRARN